MKQILLALLTILMILNMIGCGNTPAVEQQQTSGEMEQTRTSAAVNLPTASRLEMQQRKPAQLNHQYLLL